MEATWRKSSYSGAGTNASCVEIASLPPTIAVGESWRKSSHSGNGTSGDCVEIAALPLTTAVRDSKNPTAGMLTFPAAPWNTFLTSIVDG